MSSEQIAIFIQYLAMTMIDRLKRRHRGEVVKFVTYRRHVYSATNYSNRLIFTEIFNTQTHIQHIQNLYGKPNTVRLDEVGVC